MLETQYSAQAGRTFFAVACPYAFTQVHQSRKCMKMLVDASCAKIKIVKMSSKKAAFDLFMSLFGPICTASSDNPNLRIEVQQRKGSALSQRSCGKFGIQLCKFHLNGIGIHDSITIYTQDLQIRWHNACVHHSLNMPKLPCEELCHLLWAWYNIVSYKKKPPNSHFHLTFEPPKNPLACYSTGCLIG